MRLLVVCLIISMHASVFCQNFDFGKVSKEELNEKYHPLDSSASAAYLYKYRKTFYKYYQGEGFKLVTDVHERIKIYSKEGFDYATKIVGLYKDNSSRETVNGLKGYTFNLVDDKVEEVKLKKDGIFKTERSKYFDQTKFTMPNAKAGSIIEYQYKIVSPFYSNIDEFIFQHDIPVKKLDMKLETPEYFNFKLNTKGFLLASPNITTKRDKITFNTKTRSGFTTTKTTYSSNDVEFTKTIYEYNLAHVPALKEEPYVNNIKNYRASAKYELSYVKFPDTPIDYVSTTWEDVVKTIYESSNFGDELNKTSYFKDDVDAIINETSDPLKRTALLFNFIKTQVKWNGDYSKYTREGVKKAYKEHVGNTAEINLMLTAMLKYAGLNAYPVLVSTRQNGIPLFPTREGYNYVISYVKFSNGGMLLDATNKYSVPNVLPFRVLNWQGRIIAEKGGSTLIDLYPKEKSENNITVIAKLDEHGELSGGYRSIKTKHRALSFRERYIDVDEDDFIEKLENKYDGMEISDYQVKNEDNLAKPVTEIYKFLKEDQADIIGDKLYFSPMVFFASDENPFKLEERKYPVDFGYPSSTSYRINISLPEDYKIESMPKPEAFSLPDNLGRFQFNITSSNNIIQLSVKAQINQPIIVPEYYDALKAYFSKLIEKENEQIVLTRI